MGNDTFRCLLLDLDGTLTDSRLGITRSVAYALDYFGIEVSSLDSLCSFIGPPLMDSFMEHYHFPEEQARLAVRKYRERYARIGIFENELYPGIESFLKHRKESGQELILATSKPESFARKILDHFCIDGYFSLVCGSLDDGSRSAKADVIRYALEMGSGTVPDDVLMIGDTRYDICGARQNGIRSLGVLYGYDTRMSLETAGADFLVNSVADLDHFFER